MDFQYTVTKQDSGLTINGILRRRCTFSARTRTKLKQQGLIFLNGKATDSGVVPNVGDVIGAKLPEEKSEFIAEDIPIYPVYEDQDILILNKQAGVITHPTKGTPCHTLANGLMRFMEQTNQSFKIRFVNRLDMDTTGLLIVAKTAQAQERISRQMQADTTEKRYQAVVHGTVEQDAFTIDLPIGRPDPENPARAVMREGGAPCITHVRVLERFGEYTLVELRLETGRAHQIRVHMAHLGHPLVGDPLYGKAEPELIGRQALHSCYLAIDHPTTQKRLTLEAPLPEDMQALLKKIRT